MRIIFACGGTAGHINPALAVAGRIKELMPDSEFLFIGAVGQMESDLVPRAGYKIETVRVRGLSREKTLGGFFHNISAAWHLVRSTIKARKIIKRFKPDVVVGTGGYVCFPVLKAASMLGIPTAVHESNADPGLTTRMLSGIVDTIMLGFEESRKFYKNPEKTAEAFVQNPLNSFYPEKVYKTGDIVKYNEKGEIIYITRKDFQIKRQGYRIELGEIEAGANSVENVKACACIYDKDADCLALIYEGRVKDPNVVLAGVKAKVPPYMYPDKVLRIKDMPKNANGKLDRKKLQTLYKEL